jgi:hypothetical protein
MNNISPLNFNGTQIRTDEHERINMTDLWKSTDRGLSQNPNNWTRFEGSEFIKAVAKKLNTSVARILETKHGRAGGTYAHKQIALAYAKYLSHDLHMYVNQVFFERLEEETNPELGITRSHERAIESWKKQGRGLLSGGSSSTSANASPSNNGKTRELTVSEQKASTDAFGGILSAFEALNPSKKSTDTTDDNKRIMLIKRKHPIIHHNPLVQIGEESLAVLLVSSMLQVVSLIPLQSLVKTVRKS